jgi:hypothetical protein
MRKGKWQHKEVNNNAKRKAKHEEKEKGKKWDPS